MMGKPEKYERYGNEEEAEACRKARKLVQKPGHESQPKWIAESGKVDPRRLGKPKNYRYRIDIVAKNGAKEWLKQFEIKPENEPNRYAIPSDELEKFNEDYLISISIYKRGARQ